MCVLGRWCLERGEKLVTRFIRLGLVSAGGPRHHRGSCRLDRCDKRQQQGVGPLLPVGEGRLLFVVGVAAAMRCRILLGGRAGRWGHEPDRMLLPSLGAKSSHSVRRSLHCLLLFSWGPHGCRYRYSSSNIRCDRQVAETEGRGCACGERKYISVDGICTEVFVGSSEVGRGCSGERP